MGEGEENGVKGEKTGRETGWRKLHFLTEGEKL